jgi:hypothetical protein
MPHCVMRTKDGDGPWTPCPQPATTVDPDGAALCEYHLDFLWFCECGRFNVAGNGMLCQVCQAEGPATAIDSLFG